MRSSTQAPAVTFSRRWAMPSAETFAIPPIADLLRRYLEDAQAIIDPFARNSTLATVTNDLSPATSAQHHLPGEEFAAWCVGEGIIADAVLFDPPYSPRQIAEVYQQIGRRVGQAETQNARIYAEVKRHLSKCLRVGGVAISCGWNSNGFGIGRGFALLEVLLVAHGGAHNDTIVTVERKVNASLFDTNQQASPFPAPGTEAANE